MYKSNKKTGRYDNGRFLWFRVSLVTQLRRFQLRQQRGGLGKPE